MLQRRLGWQQKMTEKVRAKKDFGELWISRCRLSTKEQAEENGDSAKGQNWNEKGGNGGKDGGQFVAEGASARKEEKGKRKVARGQSRTCCTCGKTGHIAACCRKEETQICTPLTKTTVRMLKSRQKNEEDLQAWCLLEESENEQWQEVISKQNKRRVKKDNQASLLSMENSHNSNPKKVVEGKDKWMKVRVTMDSGAAGHVMPETMFPRVKLERKTTPKKFVAANWVRKQFRSRQTREFRGAQHSEVRMLSNPSVQCKRSSEPETLWCWMKRIRPSETFEMEQ